MMTSINMPKKHSNSKRFKLVLLKPTTIYLTANGTENATHHAHSLVRYHSNKSEIPVAAHSLEEVTEEEFQQAKRLKERPQ